MAAVPPLQLPNPISPLLDFIRERDGPYRLAPHHLDAFGFNGEDGLNKALAKRQKINRLCKGTISTGVRKKAASLGLEVVRYFHCGRDTPSCKWVMWALAHRLDGGTCYLVSSQLAHTHGPRRRRRKL